MIIYCEALYHLLDITLALCLLLYVYIMQDFLEMRKYTYERLDGSIRAEERFAAIRNFSQKSSASNIDAYQSTPFIFLISTRAGGVGLNLVAADTVSLLSENL